MSYIRGISPIFGLKFSLIKINNNIFICYFLNRLYYILLPYNLKTLDLVNNSSFLISYNFKLHSLNYIYSFLKVAGRIVFKGKGYRVKLFRTKKKITFNFGHSHWTKLKVYRYWDFFKRRRQSYVFFGLQHLHYLKFKRELGSIRVMNRYTQRGLRIKKQSIKKRFGKISQYISSLH